MQKSVKNLFTILTMLLLVGAMLLQLAPFTVLAYTEEVETSSADTVSSESLEISEEGPISKQTEEVPVQEDQKSSVENKDNNLDLVEQESALSSSESNGFFYFMAVSDNYLIAEPIVVDYVLGDTIVSALNRSQHAFEGLDENIITSVNGVTGNFGLSYSNQGNYVLDRLDVTPEILASNLLVVKDEADSFKVSENFLLLITELFRYEHSMDAQRYNVAVKLYEGILRDLPLVLTDDAQAVELYNALKRAIDSAEGQYEGASRPVEALLTHGEDTLTSGQANVSFTNRFGTTFTVEAGETIDLLPEEYTFVASIPNLNKKAKGTFIVEKLEENEESGQVGTQTFSLAFPGDNYWLTGVCFGLSSSSPTIQYNPVDRLTFDFPVFDNSASATAYAGLEWSEKALAFGTTYRKAVIRYEPTNGTAVREIQVSNTSTASRPSTSMTYFIPSEGGSRNVPYVATLTDVENDLVFTQEYTLNLVRPRTLSDLKVIETSGAAPLNPVFAPTTYAYTVELLDTNESLDILPTAFASYESGYRVYVNDKLASEGEVVTVDLKEPGENQDSISIQVQHSDGTISDEYVIIPKLVSAVSVKISIPKMAELKVMNSVGTIADYSILNKQNPNYNTYTFDLAEEQSFDYLVTQDIYYTTSGSFTATEDVDLNVTVDTNNYVESIKMRQNASSDNYISVEGEEIRHELSATIPDTYSASRIKVDLKEGVIGRTISASYLQQTIATSSNNAARTMALTSGREATLTSFITAGGRGQNLELVIRQVDGEYTREQTYNIILNRELHLRNNPMPEFIYDGMPAIYSPSFNQNQFDGYEVVVDQDATELVVGAGQSGSIRSTEIEEPYTITINGTVAEPVSELTTSSPMMEARIPLNGSSSDEEIIVELSNSYGGFGEYRFIVKKSASFAMTFSIDPVDALLSLYDGADTRIWPDEEGKFTLLVNSSYKYVLSKNGYVTESNTFIANPEANHLDLSLELAEANQDIDPTIDVEWNKFRGNDNTGVTIRETPTSAEESQLYWAYMSSGMSHSGQPIVLDDYVAVFTGNKLQYLDLLSGELVAEGILFSGGGLVPVYSDGMIFAPVTNGLQAFNAKPRPQNEDDIGYTNSEVMVLDSLWIYRDPIGGAGGSPFYVEDGYLYGGWQQVRSEGAFVCLSITDEDPTQTHEEKEATWRWIRNRGFYWAGAHVSENFVVVGGEQSGDDDLTCLDAKTGKVLDTIPNLFTAENRGSISYDQGTDRYCLATKDTFYSVRIDKNGKFYDLAQGSIGGSSTSTPAIYNGRAYIGVSGNGQFQSFTGSGIMVLDIETAQPVYAMSTRGYPQSSGLISTAYLDVPHYNPQTGQEETGFVYVYFTENVNPGNISYIIDKPGITQPVISEDYGGVETSPLLFAPKGHHSQYSLSSLQVDRYGTLYMKTDRGYIMAIGQKIEKLKLKQEPDCTVYFPGDEFRLTGIQIMAKYSNGLERDVSKYVKASDSLLIPGQTSIEISLPYALYNNNTPNDYIDSIANSTFDKLPRPSVAVPITVLNDEEAHSVEEIIDLINVIGTVEYNTESSNKIRKARLAYNLSDPIIRPAIENFQTLLDAEARYELLEQAVQGKLPASKIIENLSQLSVNTYGPIAIRVDDQVLLEAVTLNLQELQAIEDGKMLNFTLEATVLDQVPVTEKFFVDAALQQNKLRSTGYILDIKFSKEVETCEEVYVNSLFANKEIKLEIPIPSEYREAARNYSMLNVHGGGTYHLINQDSSNSSKVLINTGRFSTYILTYTWLDVTPDKPTPDANEEENSESTNTGDKGTNLPTNPGGNRLPTDSPNDGNLLPINPATGTRLPTSMSDNNLLTSAGRTGRAGREEQFIGQALNKDALLSALLEDADFLDDTENRDEFEGLIPEDSSDSVKDERNIDEKKDTQDLVENQEINEESKSYEKAGENLTTILWFTVIVVALILLGIVLLKRKNKNS